MEGGKGWAAGGRLLSQSEPQIRKSNLVSGSELEPRGRSKPLRGSCKLRQDGDENQDRDGNDEDDDNEGRRQGMDEKGKKEGSGGGEG